MLEAVALVSGWLLVVMAAVTCFDVLARKTGIPAPLTKLQELEWHFHAALFSLWMGYGYTINANPRVDSFTENLTLPAQGLDRARRLPALRAALLRARRLPQPGFRRAVLRARRAVR